MIAGKAFIDSARTPEGGLGVAQDSQINSNLDAPAFDRLAVCETKTKSLCYSY
jgi:hypothetical protein